ncbi:unnamed protein product [Trichobilharzia szidati]|nr:unnamed protein product [Trichobilharzia szidati]
MKSSILLIVICISISLDRGLAGGHYSELPPIIGNEGGPDRRFMNKNLYVMGYMFYLISKTRDALRQHYGIEFRGCSYPQSLCWVTSKRFYMFNEDAANHPDVSKQLPMMFYDQTNEAVPELAELDLRHCKPKPDPERFVLGMLQALDEHIEYLKDQSKSFTSKHKPKPGSDIFIYFKDLETLEKLFLIDSLEAQKPELICSITGCDCLSRIYRNLMKLNFQLKTLWNDGLKSNME